MSTKTGLRPIETIRPGDRVWAFNHRLNEWQLKLVLQNFERAYDTDLVHVTVGGETIQTTMLHPFWVISGKDLSERPVRSHLEKPPEDSKVPGRWVDATDLRPGDQVLRQDGTEPVITHVEHKPANTTVYNFSVDELRCYAVGQTRILVHNSNGIEDLAAGKKIALGIGEYLDEFANTNAAETWKQFAKADPLKWKSAFLKEMADPSNKVLFNLDGVDVWGGVSRGATPLARATDWELTQIFQNKEWWIRIRWMKGGKEVPNPFQ